MTSGLVAPHSSARRAELLEQLIAALGTDGLALRDRSLADPTGALLDAWATVGDVLGFYLDRIADEGYLSSAIDAGSILALASLVGRRPQLGVAAQTYVAYTLTATAADTALQLPAAMLSQSVPVAGQQPQIFETASPLLARPSWSLLTPVQSRPLSVDGAAGAAQLGSLVISGTAANLAANDTILLDVAGEAQPVVLQVASAQADLSAGRTTVTLQQPPPAQALRAADLVATAPVPVAPRLVTDAIDGLIAGGLTRLTHGLAHRAQPRSATEAFAGGSDTVTRLIATLEPALAPTLYSALDTTPLGSTGVTGAAVLRTTAAPFGAQAPPRPVFSASGQPAGTVDWPIQDAHTLTLSMSRADVARVLSIIRSASEEGHAPDVVRALSMTRAAAEEGNAVLEISAQTGSEQGSDVIELTPPWRPADLAPVGRATLTVARGVGTLTYRGEAGTPFAEIVITASAERGSDAIKLGFDGGAATYVWDPRLRTTVRTQVGSRQLTIAWSATGKDATLSLSLVTPLPMADRAVLTLDGRYDAIVAGSRVVVNRAGAPGAGDVTYPVVATVTAVAMVAASGYGLTAKVTRLTLDRDWIAGADVLATALRLITVKAAPAPLTLASVPVTDDVADDALELDTLVAGMDAGRLIVVRGTRTDLPRGASAPGAEVAIVKQISAGGGAGETAHTTLTLAGPLAYRYERSSVQVYGNVVAAHQGATVTEVLGSGRPSLAHQSFTLSTAPLLADPASGAVGAQSTLTVTVNGVGYQEVDRFDDRTPPHAFLTGLNAEGQTTITFAGPLPTGSENILAAYRAGDGGQGNVAAQQATQLLTRPAGVASVTNPLPGTGGLAGEGPDAVRAAAPRSLGGLGRVVTVSDYADLALQWVGVAAATARQLGGDRAGHPGGVLVTIAGEDPVGLDPHGALCTGIKAALAQAGDPAVGVAVVPARLYVICLAATVVHDPLAGADVVLAATRAALLAAFGYAQRELDQDVALGDLIAAAHSVMSVRSFTVNGLVLVPADASAADLAIKLPVLLRRPVPAVLTVSAADARWQAAGMPPATAAAATAARARGAALAYLTGAVMDTLLLTAQPS